ncbi:MAG: HAD family hydrolase [Candidatus Hydrogenedentes bacterium]|nr:HAD family hydrolase [Candidatus Hydrogenedentota bacterium]
MRVTVPEAVLFDMGGVLLESADMWDDSGFHKSYPKGLPDGTPVEWFLGLSRAILQAYEALPQPRPAMDPRPIIAAWLERLPAEPSPANVERWYAVLSDWEVRPLYSFVRPTLERLSEMGFRIGLISNTLMVSDSHRRLFREGGILNLFEFMVFSAEFGMNKPDPSIFRHALESMKLDPARAWYVGDKPHRDVCGAHSVGMTAVLVDSIYEGRTHDGPEYVPDLRIPDISALPDLLESLHNARAGMP